jgi:hypothetical protein
MRLCFSPPALNCYAYVDDTDGNTCVVYVWYTGWSKSHATHSRHVLFVKKINYIEITKKEVFSFCPAHFLCHRNGSPDKTLSICLAKENREMYPWTHSGKLSKNKVPGSVRQQTLIALVKRHPCTSTVERQMTDWREQVTTWHDLRGLLYDYRNIVCLLIQLNCTELQPSIHILIWVAWFFDHPVVHILYQLGAFKICEKCMSAF